MQRKYIILICVWLFLSMSSFAWAGNTVTSGVTAQDIIDRVRYDLNDTDSGTYSDAFLANLVDEAIWEIVSRTQCLETGASNMVVSDGVRNYALADASGVSSMAVIKVEFDIGVDSGATKTKSQIYDLTRVPFKMLRYAKEKEVGDPKTFAVNNNTLYVWPIPRSEQSGNTLYVYRSLMPAGVSSTSSVIETPASLDPAIWHYVRARALYREEKEARGNYYMGLFETMVQRYEALVMQRDIRAQQ